MIRSLTNHNATLTAMLTAGCLLAVAACDHPDPLQTNTLIVQPSTCDPDEGLILYEQQIAPLIRADNPASCEKCHLAGTKLTQFVTGLTPCEAMACLVDRQLVDLESPTESLVLDWITRGMPEEPGEPSPAHREYEAFSEWIEYSGDCHLDNCGHIPNPCKDPSEEIICSTDDPERCGITREGLNEGRDFLRNTDLECTERDMAKAFHLLVTPWRNRCSHCHAPSGSLSDLGDPPATPWMDDGMLHDGDEDASLRTMRQVIDRGLVNAEEPGQSLLLLKPLWESQGGVEHGGGDKFRGVTDETYRNYLVWAIMYSRCAPLSEDPTLVR